MDTKEQKRASNIKTFKVKKRSTRSTIIVAGNSTYVLNTSTGNISWKNRKERVKIIRKGLPYESIEIIGQKANMPVKRLLNYWGIAQTTYNKKKREQDHMNVRDSELLLILSEVLDYGFEVFNNEKEKFQRWLKKPNISLGNVTPESLFDSITGIQEVRNALTRLDYGNMA
jgi:putative toxin-antitoxin system antitoxin component (TIGR02293 family)